MEKPFDIGFMFLIVFLFGMYIGNIVAVEILQKHQGLCMLVSLLIGLTIAGVGYYKTKKHNKNLNDSRV